MSTGYTSLLNEIMGKLSARSFDIHKIGWRFTDAEPNRLTIYGSKRMVERAYALLDYEPGGEPGNVSPFYEFQFPNWSDDEPEMVIARKSQLEEDESVGLITEEVVRKIDHLVYEGLRTDGGHHKQWYLYQIGELLGIDLSNADPGMAP